MNPTSKKNNKVQYLIIVFIFFITNTTYAFGNLADPNKKESYKFYKTSLRYFYSNNFIDNREINLTDHTKGMYFYTIRNNNKLVHSGKFIIQ